MELVVLRPGEFLMGSLDSDTDAAKNEKPQHRVRITRAFVMGAYEVTVGQFRRFVDATHYRTEGERNGQGSYGLDLTTGKVEPRPEYTWKNWLKEDKKHPSDFQQTD